jgi:hypothetical protein
MEDPNAEARGSARIVANYDTYAEGDEDPYQRKKICTLIAKDVNFIVYLDDKNAVRWGFHGTYGELPPDAAAVLNRVSALAAIPIEEIPVPVQTAFRRMLGEAVARVIGFKDRTHAEDILDKAERYVTAFRESVAREWHLQSTIVTTALFVIVATVAWWCRDAVRRSLGPAVLELVLASAAGAVGGFLSFASRSRLVEVDPSAGRRGYYFMGVARSFGAASGAVAAALAVKTKVILAFLAAPDGSSPIVGLLITGVVAGVSERLVPNLVRSIDERGAGKQ